MRRREFILFGVPTAFAAGGAFAAWAEQKVPVVGFLNSASSGPAAPLLAAFRQALEKAGYVEDRNVSIEYRWAEGHYDQLPSLAAELVGRKVAVIAATGGLVTAQAALTTTKSIPVLFIAGFDPVREGLVASINRPGGNATGVSVYTVELGRKRMQILRELLPSVSKIAVLVNPHSTSAAIERQDLVEAAQLSGLELFFVEASSDGEIERGFSDAVNRGAGALIVSADSFFTSRRNQIVSLAARHALPASYPWPQYADAGGLISYGPNLTWAYERLGTYAGRILKGASPSELPVQLPTTFETVINMKTAKSLGVSVPPFVLALANRVVE